MDSKLRDKIAEALAVQGVTDGYICDKTKAIADSILALLAHELEKARLWDRLEEYVKGECTLCPISGACMHVTYCILMTLKYDIVTGKVKHMDKSDALSKEAS